MHFMKQIAILAIWLHLVFSVGAENVFLPLKKEIKVFPTVADLISDKSVKPNDYVKVLGYYQVNDGGMASYLVSQNIPTDSITHSLKMVNGLHAVLLTPSTVNYKIFGARGDGLNNDAIQIAAAHDYANAKNLPVLNSNGSYWLKGIKKIVIQTDVNWGKTIFHIDENHNTAADARFEIRSGKVPIEIPLSDVEKKALLLAVKPGVSRIPMLAKYKNCLVFMVDSKDRIGYRSGKNFEGQSWAREEFFYVEEHGKIIGDIAWAFKDITQLVAYPLDEHYLRVSGGAFYLSGNSPTTTKREYLKTGFSILRSKTILSDQWVGLEPGASDTSTLNPRAGFYSFARVFDVRLENVRLIPFEQNRGSESKNVLSGTYGILMARVLNCTFKNVTAEGSNVHWGVFGANLVKDFKVENSRLNRVDVHFHCWNLKITDSHIGQKGITVTGGGQLTVENSSCSGSSFINFRSDFGSKWDGDIRITNSAFHVASGQKNVAVLAFLPHNFNYHYPVGFGRSITIENFTLYFDESEKKNEAICWMMRIPTFSKMTHGQRLFFPQQVKFENIKVKGREQGVRLMDIQQPGSFELVHKARYQNGTLRSNAQFDFKNIHLEDLSTQPTAAAHFLMGETTPYDDDNALFPTIQFSNCKNLIVQTAGVVANIFMENSEITAFNTLGESPLKGRLVFTRCSFYPVIKDSKGMGYQVDSETGTSFTDCVVHAPQLNGVWRPDLFHNISFIELNKKVKFNHSNTILGRETIDYFKKNKIPFLPKFIAMLKSHHEMEPESL